MCFQASVVDSLITLIIWGKECKLLFWLRNKFYQKCFIAQNYKIKTKMLPFSTEGTFLPFSSAGRPPRLGFREKNSCNHLRHTA